MQNLYTWNAGSALPRVTILIRVMVGAVFLSEGIQKFLYPATLGVGRFVNIGLPAPAFLSYFVAVFEVVCGALILIGWFTRLAAIPMIIDMVVAISSTKIPILMHTGFWAMAHEARTDFSMLLGSVFLVLTGGGSWSVDGWLSRRKKMPAAEQGSGNEIGT